MALLLAVHPVAESGAALCRADGLSEAQHALWKMPAWSGMPWGCWMSSCRLSAAGLADNLITTCLMVKGLSFDPINLITLTEGKKGIFETEQDARSDFMERIRRSLNNKISFFE